MSSPTGGSQNEVQERQSGEDQVPNLAIWTMDGVILKRWGGGVGAGMCPLIWGIPWFGVPPWLAIHLAAAALPHLCLFASHGSGPANGADSLAVLLTGNVS